MEAITQLVAESLARYGFDRPVDYRRLHWSRWFRCESLHSLLYVPSKPGVFALAEEVMELGADRVGTAVPGCSEQSPRGYPAEQSSAPPATARVSGGAPPSKASSLGQPLGGALQRCDLPPRTKAASAAEGQRHMLAVLQFCEDDDMAFVLDRMLSRQNPMSARLASGRCFVRFVTIEDEAQRRSICAALNQWLISSGEKASGIGAHFASSLEWAPVAGHVGRTLLSANVDTAIAPSGPPGQHTPPTQTSRPGVRPHISIPEQQVTFTALSPSPPVSDPKDLGTAALGTA